MISIGAALAMAAAATMAGIVVGAVVQRWMMADEIKAAREDADGWRRVAGMWQRIDEMARPR